MAIEDFLWRCPYKKYLGIECLGCGAQTALLHLLQGNFSEAWQTFPAIYTLMLLALVSGFYFLSRQPLFKKMIFPLIVLNTLIIIVQYYWKTL